MGFPMLATAFWLLSLLPIHYGERSWWLGVFLVIVALAAWIFGEFVQRGRSRRGFALVVTAALLIMGYAVVVEGHLRWRSPEIGNDHSAALKNAPRGLPWQPWSPEAVASARAARNPVVVDFTATWCPNCKAIVQPTLENPKIQKKIAEINATLLLGDYTKFPDNITDELNKFKRAGVPMVLVYPRDPNEPPIVFDVVLPGKLLQALEQAER
jgi:thiol:disulfide interchange protein DsbD